MDIILTQFFEILPVSYFLLFISFGISALIIDTLFSFFDD